MALAPQTSKTPTLKKLAGSACDAKAGGEPKNQKKAPNSSGSITQLGSIDKGCIL
jgi:hypothetical protein